MHLFVVATFSAVGCLAPADPEEAVDARGVGAGGAALSGRARGVERRGDGHGCGPPLWGGAPDGARVAAEVRGPRPGWVGGSDVAAVVVPTSDACKARGLHRGDASGASGVGAAHDRVLARTRWCRSVAGADVGGAVLDPPWAGRSASTEAQAERLQALGTVAVDGVVADGHRRRGAARRRE